ncbi:MAG: sulfotransferase [Pseudomonadota bacterium]
MTRQYNMGVASVLPSHYSQGFLILKAEGNLLSDSISSTGLSSDISLEYILECLRDAQDVVLPARALSKALQAPVFVVGCPRSGTTVLGKSLAAHPNLAGSEESLFLLDLWRIILDLHQGINRRRWAPLSNYVTLPSLVDVSGEFADRIFSGLLAGAKNVRLVEHTPWYAGLEPLLGSLFPDCYVLHLIRDGRDVVESLSNSYERGFQWAGASTRTRTTFWAGLVEASWKGSRHLKSERYREFRYEDLCRMPRETLGAILQWIGLEWDERVLIPLSEQHASPSRPKSALATIDENGAVHVKSRIVGGRWPPNWSRAKKQEFIEQGNATLARHGYPALSAEE